jgi:predicted alpha/beta-fold hydrolase
LNSYTPPFYLFNAHLETILPSLTRRVRGIAYQRERINTPDDDFLDLDWVAGGSSKLVIISHGLEGNSTRGYMLGMARAFSLNSYDVLTWNYRGCSEEMNRQKRFYHSGATDDLHTVITHAIALKRYDEINLIGFSLGGNVTLKYLGERTVDPIIKKAVAISVPMDLKTSCEKISRPENWVYANRFVKSLKLKILNKSRIMSGIDVTNIDGIKTLLDFDNRYTAPLHGFRDALTYYHECSSIRFVSSIKTPTLIINAQNDPFLSPECYPSALLKDHAAVKFESPLRGGHVGFSQVNKNGLYWSETRALDFITND